MRALTRTPPLPTLRLELDRLFEDIFPAAAAETRADLMPPFDFTETDEAYIVRMDLPGVNQQDIHISLEDRRLSVSGERRHEVEEKHENYHRVERSFGSFFRAITLPGEVKADQVDATLDAGVLRVRIPKSEASKPRRIEVRGNDR